MKIKSLILCLLLAVSNLIASSVELTWNPACMQPAPDSYNIYYGYGTNQPVAKINFYILCSLTNFNVIFTTNYYYGIYTNTITVPGNTTNCVISNLVNGATYYVAMTSVSSWGESYYSPEYSFTTPSYPTYTNGGRLPTLTLEPSQFTLSDDLFIPMNWSVLGTTNLINPNWVVIATGSNSFVNCVITNNGDKMFFRLKIN